MAIRVFIGFPYGKRSRSTQNGDVDRFEYTVQVHCPYGAIEQFAGDWKKRPWHSITLVNEYLLKICR
jgi:hypothetical protein